MIKGYILIDRNFVYKVFPVPPGTVMSIIRLVREEIDETF